MFVPEVDVITPFRCSGTGGLGVFVLLKVTQINQIKTILRYRQTEDYQIPACYQCTGGGNQPYQMREEQGPMIKESLAGHGGTGL